MRKIDINELGLVSAGKLDRSLDDDGSNGGVTIPIPDQNPYVGGLKALLFETGAVKKHAPYSLGG